MLSRRERYQRCERRRGSNSSGAGTSLCEFSDAKEIPPGVVLSSLVQVDKSYRIMRTGTVILSQIVPLLCHILLKCDPNVMFDVSAKLSGTFEQYNPVAIWKGVLEQKVQANDSIY